MKKKLLILGVLATLLFTGCGSSDKESAKKIENSSSQMEQTEKMDKNQELNLFLAAEPKTLDPSKGTDSYSSMILIKITEPLVTTWVDENGGEKIVPAGAESWTVSEDNLVYTFKIRDMKWEDGKTVTAADYAYGMLRTLDPKTGSIYAFLMSPIKNADQYNSGKVKKESVGVKVLDEKTLQVTLKTETPYMMQLSYFPTFFPQRKDMVEKYGDRYGTEANTMLSCGPFKLDKWVHSNKVVFIKNDTYWDTSNVILTKITFNIVTDENSRMNLMYNGQIDIGVATKPEWVEKFQSTGEFNTKIKYELGTNYSYFNQTNKYFKNKKIRKAFSLAINREELNQVIFNGKFEPAYGFVAKGISIQGELYENEPLKDIKEDPKQLLREGLEELGFSTDPSKMNVTYLASGSSSWNRKYAEYMQQSFLKSLGVNMKAEFVEWPVFQKRVQEMDYEFAGAAWTGDYNDPNTFLDIWMSTNTIVNTGYKSKKYDDLLKKAAHTTDKNERTQYFKQAENLLLVEDVTIAPTLYRKKNTLIRKYVKGYNPSVIQKFNYKGVYISGRE